MTLSGPRALDMALDTDAVRFVQPHSESSPAHAATGGCGQLCSATPISAYHEVMSIDVAALVEALRVDPSQRAALRDALGMTDVDVRSALNELAQAQTRTEARLDQLAQAQTRTEARLDELAQAQARTEARVDELTKNVSALALQVAELSQAVKGLLDVVAGMQDRLGKLDGSDLERRYRERGPAYLGRLARRLQLVTSQRLSEMVDDAEVAGLLNEQDADALMVTDAVFSGQDRHTREPIHLTVEVSVTVDRTDIRRARERADLLGQIVDTPVIAVVAGDHVPEAVAQAAQDADVWCVARGHVLGPQDDIDEFR